MKKLERPVSLRTSVHRARYFYTRTNALPMYDHCHRVFRRAVDEKIVEGDAIADFKTNPERAKVNSIIAECILYHVVEFDHLAGIRDGTISLPLRLDSLHPLRDPEITREIEAFSHLTRLDREGVPLEGYVPILNNGQAPLALLARMADYAVTHDTEERTPDHTSRKRNSLFRLYSSKQHAKTCLEMDAKAGERLYAPIAELFGYPNLAGDILRHAYRINHPLIHDHVDALFADEKVCGQLHETQSVARRLGKRIKSTLQAAGFEVSVVQRLDKHRGKVMRKFYRNLTERYAKLSNGMPMQDFTAQHLHEYDLRFINDPVALKVIIEKFLGEDVDAMPEAKQKAVIKVAKESVMIMLKVLRIAEGFKFNHAFVKKENGYTAHHFHARPIEENGKLPIEVQVKTKEWDDIASHGKAAHYYYLGNDTYVGSDYTKFIKTVKGAYTGILRKTYTNNG